MFFPKLVFNPRDREYKVYQESLRDRLIYEYLFLGKSRRWLDENILGQNAEYSRGWQSFGILNYVGLTDEHKGIFVGKGIQEALSFLIELHDDNYNLIISALTRYSQSLKVEPTNVLYRFTPPSTEDDDAGYPEGKIAYRTHKIIERDPKVIKKAKDKFSNEHGGHLYCQACNFDFSKFYGSRGADFIEGHHTKLVSEMKEGEETKVEDIALLCSNCHRMIHRKPLMSVDDLKTLILKR